MMLQGASRALGAGRPFLFACPPRQSNESSTAKAQQSLVRVYFLGGRHGRARRCMEVIMLKYCAILLIVLAANSLADEVQAPQPERKILGKHDQTGVPGKEVVIGTATFPAGTVIAFHTHPGDESVYIIKGSVTVKIRGTADVALKAGDGFFNPRG